MRDPTIVAVVLLAALFAGSSATAVPLVPPGFEVELISTGTFSLEQPSGLAIDEQGNIFIGLNRFFGGSEVLRITPSGEVSSVATFDDFIGGLALDSSQRLFGSLFNQTVFRVENGVASTFATGLPQDAAEQLDFNSADDLFVAHFNAGTISKITPDGTVSTFVGGLGGPFGVAFQGDTLFIGDNANNGSGPGLVLRSLSMGLVTEFFSPIPGRLIDLELHPFSGNFFVANQDSRRIEEIVSGELVAFAAGFSGFPREVEFDSLGNLYVADASSLYRISIPEPSKRLLLALGLAGLGAMRMRSRAGGRRRAPARWS